MRSTAAHDAGLPRIAARAFQVLEANISAGRAGHEQAYSDARRGFATRETSGQLLMAVLLAALSMPRCFCPREAWPPGRSDPSPSPPPPPPQTPPQPYDGQLLRLSEILGALSYLTSICDTTPKDPSGRRCRR